MNRELWIAVLTFVLTVLTLVPNVLPVPPEIVPWLTFAGLVIEAALTVFFGVSGIRARRAAKAAAAKK